MLNCGARQADRGCAEVWRSLSQGGLEVQMLRLQSAIGSRVKTSSKPLGATAVWVRCPQRWTPDVTAAGKLGGISRL